MEEERVRDEAAELAARALRRAADLLRRTPKPSETLRAIEELARKYGAVIMADDREVYGIREVEIPRDAIRDFVDAARRFGLFDGRIVSAEARLVVGDITDMPMGWHLRGGAVFYDYRSEDEYDVYDIMIILEKRGDVAAYLEMTLMLVHE